MQLALDEMAEATQDKLADAIDAWETALASELGAGKAKLVADEAWTELRRRCDAASDKFEVYAARNVFGRDEEAVRRGRKRRESETAMAAERVASEQLDKAGKKLASTRALRRELQALAEAEEAEEALFGEPLSGPGSRVELRPLWQSAEAAVAQLRQTKTT